MWLSWNFSHLPRVVVAFGICWLAGGSYLDLKNVYGCSRTSIYRARDLFLDAVNSCKELSFPSNSRGDKKAKRSFKRRVPMEFIQDVLAQLIVSLQKSSAPI
jgi:hypothetical protein